MKKHTPSVKTNMNLLLKSSNLIPQCHSHYSFWTCRLILILTCFYNVSAHAQIITGNPSVCQGDSSTLTANDGFQSYKWSNSSLAKSINVGASGKYFITVTDGRGIPMVDSFVFTAHPLPDGTIIGRSEERRVGKECA